MRVVSQAKLDLQTITPMVTHTHSLTYSTHSLLLTYLLTHLLTHSYLLIRRVIVTLLCIKAVGLS